jgi:hypothetical protein
MVRAYLFINCWGISTMGSIIIAWFPVTPMLVGFPLKFGLACTGENSPYDIKGHAQDQLTYTAVDI